MSWVQTVFKQKGERIVSQHAGQPQHDWIAPVPGEYGYVAHGPTPTVPIQLNWSGFQYWQRDHNLEYPAAHREILKVGSSDSTAIYLQMRNPAAFVSAAPIAIQDYALNQYQTYNGTGVTSGGS